MSMYSLKFQVDKYSAKSSYTTKLVEEYIKAIVFSIKLRCAVVKQFKIALVNKVSIFIQWEITSFLLVSQFAPVKPCIHSHTNLFVPLRQVPPFRQVEVFLQ